MNDNRGIYVLIVVTTFFAIYYVNKGTNKSAIRSNDNNYTKNTELFLEQATSSDTCATVDTSQKNMSIYENKSLTSEYVSEAESKEFIVEPKQQAKTYEQLLAEDKIERLLRSFENERYYKVQIEERRRRDSLVMAFMNEMNRQKYQREAVIQYQSSSLDNVISNEIVPQFSFGTNPNVIKVDGYNRRNGIYISPHNRTVPNNTVLDNFSTYPNYNPYTGKVGNKKF